MRKKLLFIGVWIFTIVFLILAMLDFQIIILKRISSVVFLFFSIFLLLSIYLKKRLNFSLILVFSYFIVVFLFAVKILLSLNEAQSQLTWVEVYPLITPFKSCHINLFHFFQSLFPGIEKINNENIYLTIAWVFFPFISFLIVGGIFYYLIGIWIDEIYYHFSFILDKKKRTKKDLILLMKSIVVFLCFIYLLACFKVWDELNYKYTLLLSSYEAEKDFKNKKYRYLMWGKSGENRYFSGKKMKNIEIWIEPVRQRFLLPNYLDKRNYIEHYNLSMWRLLETQTKNNFKKGIE